MVKQAIDEQQKSSDTNFAVIDSLVRGYMAKINMSFFTKDMAMDLGTANTLIMNEGKVVLNEPSIVAIDKRSGKCIAAGKEALSYSRNSNIKIVSPLYMSVVSTFPSIRQRIPLPPLSGAPASL